jgi:hypothetical protein
MPIAVASNGERIPAWERKPEELFQAEPRVASAENGTDFFRTTIEPIFQRELHQRGIVTKGSSYQAELIGWVEAG